MNAVTYAPRLAPEQVSLALASEPIVAAEIAINDKFVHPGAIGLAMGGFALFIDRAYPVALERPAYWPSLAFVLGGAVFVSMAGTRLAGRMPRPVLAAKFDIPASRRIDGRLIAGSALFGIGWGLAGFCPGPALATVPLDVPMALIFVAAMLVGMWCFGIIDRGIGTAKAEAVSTAR